MKSRRGVKKFGVLKKENIFFRFCKAYPGYDRDRSRLHARAAMQDGKSA